MTSQRGSSMLRDTHCACEKDAKFRNGTVNPIGGHSQGKDIHISEPCDVERIADDSARSAKQLLAEFATHSAAMNGK